MYTLRTKPPKVDSGLRDRPELAKIEVTPEMIEAVEKILDYYYGDVDRVRERWEIARLMLEAALLVAPRSTGTKASICDQ